MAVYLIPAAKAQGACFLPYPTGLVGGLSAADARMRRSRTASRATYTILPGPAETVLRDCCSIGKLIAWVSSLAEVDL